MLLSVQSDICFVRRIDVLLMRYITADLIFCNFKKSEVIFDFHAALFYYQVLHVKPESVRKVTTRLLCTLIFLLILAITLL